MANDFSLEKLSWTDIRGALLALNPELVNAMDEIPVDESFYCYKASYNFGDQIVKNGIFHLPHETKGLVPITDPSVPKEIFNSLFYNHGTHPACCVLKGNLEVFLEVENRIIPYGLVNPGRLLGIWKLLDPQLSHCPPIFNWEVTAGARSLFMLPSISDAIGHNRLRQQLGITSDKPRRLQEHWHVFREIANQTMKQDPWKIDIIFFTEQWFKYLLDSKWKNFHLYLLRQAWETSQFWRNQFIWDLTFARIQHRRKLSPSPYIDALVKHMLMVGVGILPGVCPAVDDSVGPISKLQQVYIDVYNIKSYRPIIMQPYQVACVTKFEPIIYFSLQFPSVMNLPPRMTKRISAINDLFACKTLMDHYLDEIKSGELNIITTPLSQLPQTAEIKYFHPQADGYQGINDVDMLGKHDVNFDNAAKPYLSQRSFPADSSFFRGCISIQSSDQIKTLE